VDLRVRIDRIFALCDPAPEAILIETGVGGGPDPNVLYATGFEWGALSGATVVLTPGDDPRLVTSPMEAERARRAAGVAVLVAEDRDEGRRKIGSALRGLGRIGYNPHGLTVARFRQFEDLLPRVSWVDVSGALTRARLVKDPDEVARIRRAAEITAETLDAVPECLEAGLEERSLAADLEYRLRRAGASGTAFEPIVAFGPGAAEPHHASGEAALEEGSLVLVDLGARWRGYSADATRTFAFGEIGAGEARMLAVVREAQAAALSTLVPGGRLGDVHRAAARVVDSSEFRGRFLHAAGHSVGLEAQDGVVIHGGSEITIEPEMVFAVEPGVYVPGTGGVRLEDTVRVTPEGPENLTERPRHSGR